MASNVSKDEIIILFKKPEAGMLTFPIITRAAVEKNKKLSAEKLAHQTPKSVTIVPGANTMKLVEWNAIKDMWKVKMYLAKDWLIIKGAKKVQNKETKEIKYIKDKELSEMSVEEQEALIEESYQIPLLEKWKKTGLKESVLSKANERIEYLKNPDADDDKMNIRK